MKGSISEAMNVQPRYPATPDEFLRWNEGREGKREFVDGRVVEMMINTTRNHWRVMNRLTFQFVERLGLERYDIGSSDFGVRTGDGIRFPDVLVEGRTEEGKALASKVPLLVAEVLSASTMAQDFGAEARDYLALLTLRHHLVLAQDEVRVWLWSRTQDGGWSGPEMTADEAGTIRLGGLEIELSVAPLHAGVNLA